MESIKILGNGNLNDGIDLLNILISRLEFARQKHDWSNINKEEGFCAIQEELNELKRAIKNDEGIGREIDECIDVLVTAIRFYNGEYNLWLG